MKPDLGLLYFVYFLCLFLETVSKMDAKWEWRWLHSEEFYSFYRSPVIMRMIKTRRFKMGGHETRMEEDGVPSTF